MLIFTVCTINQLANAFVLGDSVKNQHPNYDFFIGLVDKKENIPVTLHLPHPIVAIDEIEIAVFEAMCQVFTYSELSANCKPFFAQYFIQKSTKITYFDCTSLVYHSLDFISQTLDNQDIILVPQLLHAGVPRERPDSDRPD